jgi:hypothetical protein
MTCFDISLFIDAESENARPYWFTADGVQMRYKIFLSKTWEISIECAEGFGHTIYYNTPQNSDQRVS